MTDLDPQTLERLRRGLPLRLDRTGQFHLGDDPITHPRIRATFLAGLDRSDTGEPTLHLREQWCYLTVDDCPLRATAVLRGADDRPVLRLDDGRVVPLDPTTLHDDGHGLRASAPAQRSGRPLAVRLINNATMDLTAWIDDSTDPPTLEIGNERSPITTRMP